MKVINAETLSDGRRRFVIEAAPAVPAVLNADDKVVTPAVPAVTEEYVWGKDVPLATAQRETKLLLNAKYGKPKPIVIAGMVGKDI